MRLASEFRDARGLRAHMPAVMSLAFGLLAWGINRIDVADFTGSLFSWGCLPYLAAPLALLPLFYLVEMRSSAPALNPRVMRSRNMMLVNILSIGSGASLVSVFFLPRVAAETFHVSAAGASLRIMPAVLAFVAGSVGCGALLGKLNTRSILVAGQAIVAAGMALLAVHVGLDGAAVAGADVGDAGADGEDFDAEFVAGDARVAEEGHLAEIPANIGPADSDPMNADQGLAGAGTGRLRNGDRAEAAGLFESTWVWHRRSGVVEWDVQMERLYGLAPGTFGGNRRSK